MNNIKSDPNNPLNMIKDPYAGDSFILPETLCTNERRALLHRSNEIIAFQITTAFALGECRDKYSPIANKLPFKEQTPFKIELSDGLSVVTPFKIFINQIKKNLDILPRQTFIMLYGSFETYLHDIFERSYSEINITENTLDLSISILMKKKWKGKLSKMKEVFNVDYKDRKLVKCFSGFELNFNGTVFRNPLDFLDQLSQIRHRIVHASSIIDDQFAEKHSTSSTLIGKQIGIELKMIHPLFVFYILLSGYIDEIFSERFGYERIKTNPAEA